MELPASLNRPSGATALETELPHDQALRPRPFLSKLGQALGRIGVFTCGLAVVATASLIAIHIH